MNRTFVFLFAALALLISACGSPGAEQGADLANRTIQVAATTGMVADMAQNIGGDRVQVTGLMGPGVDPHLYKASEGDVRTLESADIIFYNGLHLEAGLAGVLERMSDVRAVHAVTDGIERGVLIAPPEFEGAYDPHVWFDVEMWMSAVKQVRDAYIELDPGSTDLYQSNTQDYMAELEELHAYVQARADEVPPERRILVTAHDAFNYFGQAYDFDVRGLQGISTESEASTSDIQDLADFIAENAIPAIFIESSVPQRTVEALQAAVQAKGLEVEIGGELFSDAMGDPGTVEGTYIGMVKHNIDTIISALKGK